MNNWDSYYIEKAKFVSSKSKDKSRKIGCVLVGPDHESRSDGWNGFPRGVDDNVEIRHSRPTKYLYTVHAELNAVLNAARIGTPLKGCTAYVNLFPCAPCAGTLIQAGIVRVVAPKPDFSDPNFGESFHVAITMFREAGVEVEYVKQQGIAYC